MSKRDYSSFSSTAKSRFRHVAKAVGFEQITGILYAKKKDGWHEIFALQASQYGSETFYVNFGICVPLHYAAQRYYLTVVSSIPQSNDVYVSKDLGACRRNLSRRRSRHVASTEPKNGSGDRSGLCVD